MKILHKIQVQPKISCIPFRLIVPVLKILKELKAVDMFNMGDCLELKFDPTYLVQYYYRNEPSLKLIVRQTEINVWRIWRKS